jgi:hypothetical protein
MMMIRRFVFTPPADHAAGLLTLPWAAVAGGQSRQAASLDS